MTNLSVAVLALTMVNDVTSGRAGVNGLGGVVGDRLSPKSCCKSNFAFPWNLKILSSVC